MKKITGFALAACVLLGGYASSTSVSRAEDWPMWGRTPNRNMVTPEKGVPTDWDVDTGKNIKWVATLGSQSYGNPVVSGGLVTIGTNNEGSKDPEVPGKMDASRLMIFDEKTGKQLFQRVRQAAVGPRQRLALPGRLLDAGVRGRPDVVLHAAVRGGLPRHRAAQAQRLAAQGGLGHDMMNNEGVFPHNMTACSTFVYKDWILHHHRQRRRGHAQVIPAPKAPSVICFEKKTGKVVWTDNTPGQRHSARAIFEPGVRGGQWHSAGDLPAGRRLALRV